MQRSPYQAMPAADVLQGPDWGAGAYLRWGKQRAVRENFPVASVLLGRKHAPAIRALYLFARGADDIADDAGLPMPTRLMALDRLIALMADPATESETLPNWVAPIYLLIQAGSAPRAEALRLLQAFRQEVSLQVVADLPALMALCRGSAGSVGRLLLPMVGETEADNAACDALCNAMQLINHLQDLKEDAKLHGRCYLPLDWRQSLGISLNDLLADRTSDGLQRGIAWLLRVIDAQLDKADALPASVCNRRLRWELQAMLAINRQLVAKLRQGDPLAETMMLSKLHKLQLIATAPLRRRPQPMTA